MASFNWHSQPVNLHLNHFIFKAPGLAPPAALSITLPSIRIAGEYYKVAGRQFVFLYNLPFFYQKPLSVHPSYPGK